MPSPSWIGWKGGRRGCAPPTSTCILSIPATSLSEATHGRGRGQMHAASACPTVDVIRREVINQQESVVLGAPVTGIGIVSWHDLREVNRGDIVACAVAPDPVHHASHFVLRVDVAQGGQH